MTAPDARRRGALSALREGRVSVYNVVDGLSAHSDDVRVGAKVTSSRPGGPTYAVDKRGFLWSCTCAASPDCAHVLAVQLVTTGTQEQAGVATGEGAAPADCPATRDGIRCALPSGHIEPHLPARQAVPA